ncbi:hydroxyacylglutathione hydrolase [Aestuariibacter halophilus]|uniref:Hydroxyacylglutathione hydrolase n=1 Tax=Fluctibacter halophilus TaxID=226011 RepID=A0ABS8G6L3_9ALTE|nr:hydroxyacylglutathione hydrolase [Aestuariibacter halophilus]MCC2616190.1 hydroxyacylglutathione hydrolase [Aestuariibacter halophilus]
MTQAIHITPIPAFNDNYIWCLHTDKDAVVVDPGDPDAVETFLQRRGLVLSGILITHHHWDHTDGLPALGQRWPDAPVFGPDNPTIDGITHTVGDGDTVTLAGLSLSLDVIAVPGHTLDHIAYVSDLGVFCGDTLFSAGCGRLFEGTAQQMHDSLQRLMQLNDDMAVYCTHEYTAANVRFALMVEPQNADLQAFSRWVSDQRAKPAPTLPSTIGREKRINPFVRVTQPTVLDSVKQHCQLADEAPASVFAALRKWKDTA